METKKILKKQKKAEDKLKERQARAEKDTADRKEATDAAVNSSVGERVRERRSSNVSATSERSAGQKEEAAQGKEAAVAHERAEAGEAEEEKGGDKYFSQLEFKDLPLSE